MVKNLPTMQETGVRSMSWEDPLEKGGGVCVAVDLICKKEITLFPQQNYCEEVMNRSNEY